MEPPKSWTAEKLQQEIEDARLREERRAEDRSEYIRGESKK